MVAIDAGEPVVHVVPAARVTGALEECVVALFVATHHDADADWVRELLGRLGTVALAFERATLVGFALGDHRRIDLPRLPAQEVHFGGFVCVADGHRRRGLMRRLGARAVAPDGATASGALVCGRLSDPVGLRAMRRLPGSVPSAGQAPSAWHRDVAAALAEAYGAAFDPATFVCRGRGRPIGAPRIAPEATADERALFAAVDRGRGDSLLAVAWRGAAPPGW